MLRVLSVPSGHVYVRHLSPLEGDTVVSRLPDPPVPGDVPAAQWWPPPSLDPTWVRDHRDEFDVAHVHFGFDARPPECLVAWVAALRAAEKPLVYTVHDLRNPHQADSELHDRQLAVLVPAADALLTLTPGAAAEIEERWGRRALVLPHPHVVPEPLLSRPRPRTGPRRQQGSAPDRDSFVVGLHLKSLRANMDPLPVLDTLAKVVPDLPGGRLRVDVHTDVMTSGMRHHDPMVAARLHELAEQQHIELAVHDFFTDDELWDYLQGLDVSVLPYRFGTHSGWLEACYDLGTTVVVSDCGYYAEQEPCLSFHLGTDGLDPATLEAALQRAHDERPQWRAEPEQRRVQRREIAAAHQDLYREVLDR